MEGGGGVNSIQPASFLPSFREQLCAKRKKKTTTLKRDSTASLESTSVLCLKPGPTSRDTPGTVPPPSHSPPPLDVTSVEKGIGGGEKSLSRLYFGEGEVFFLCARGDCRSFGGTSQLLPIQDFVS